jgi:hypothetical protein
MGKRKLDYICPYEQYGCIKKFKEEGMNEENYKRHVNTCKYARKEKKKGIDNYFSSVNKVGQTAVSNVIGGVSETSSSSHVEAEASNSNEEVVSFTSSDDMVIRRTPAESLIDIEETTVTKGNERSAVLCRGYEIVMDSGSVLSRYPFHRHDADSQDISTLIHFNITLKHGVSGTTLVAHAQTCDGIVTTSLNENINKECAELEYSPLLKKLVF